MLRRTLDWLAFHELIRDWASELNELPINLARAFLDDLFEASHGCPRDAAQLVIGRTRPRADLHANEG